MDFTETPRVCIHVWPAHAEDLIAELGRVLDQYDGLASKETIIMALQWLIDEQQLYLNHEQRALELVDEP